MKINLNKEFNQAFAECRNLQLLIIDLPDSYESSIGIILMLVDT